MSGKETKSFEKKRRRMEFPDTYIILIGLCLLAVILNNCAAGWPRMTVKRGMERTVVWQVPFMG